MWKTYLAVMFGGAIGSGLRMWVSHRCTIAFGQPFPWGTVLTNISGCLLIGLFAGLTQPGGLWECPPIIRQLVMVGVFGGFTTYSSFSLQTIELFANGLIAQAIFNILLTLILCLLGCWLGLTAAGMLRPAG